MVAPLRLRLACLILCVLLPGEANTGLNTDLYNCTFPALIEDWRETFHEGSVGQTERNFPFGFVQVMCRGEQWGGCLTLADTREGI